MLRDTDLSGEQRDAVARLLTTTTATTILTAAAGAGKTHTVAAFARAWTTLTGRRVIGLAVAENAARVLTNEGLAEQYCLVKRRREYGYSGARDTASWCRRCVSPGRRGHARA